MNMCPKCSHHVMSHAYRPVTKANNGHCLTPACDCQGWNAPVQLAAEAEVERSVSTQARRVVDTHSDAQNGPSETRTASL